MLFFLISITRQMSVQQ